MLDERATEDGKPFPKPVYMGDDDYYDAEPSIKDEVLSPHIWWFRD